MGLPTNYMTWKFINHMVLWTSKVNELIRCAISLMDLTLSILYNVMKT
jgi:hypothetical protein